MYIHLFCVDISINYKEIIMQNEKQTKKNILYIEVYFIILKHYRYLTLILMDTLIYNNSKHFFLF